MTLPVWSARFAESTRGKIVNLLRRSDATVNDLAEQLELTDNAVRVHLAGLERDGLVEQHGVQRGSGKPAYVYRLTASADQILPKAYSLVLRVLLERLRARLGEGEVEATLVEVGRAIAASRAPIKGDLPARAEAAVALLEEMGGIAEVEPHPEGLAIQGYSCPVAEVAAEYPKVCTLAAVLLEELIGSPVREACDRGRVPHCRFVIAASPSSPRAT